MKTYIEERAVEVAKFMIHTNSERNGEKIWYFKIYRA